MVLNSLLNALPYQVVAQFPFEPIKTKIDTHIHTLPLYLTVKLILILDSYEGKTVVLEKTLESSLECKEIQSIHPKGNQSWLFTGSTDVEAETPILWPPHAKSWLIWKDPDPGKDWRRDEKGMTEDKMVGWHHRLNGHEFEQAPGIGDGQASLARCSPQGRKDMDVTEQLNWTDEGKKPASLCLP